MPISINSNALIENAQIIRYKYNFFFTGLTFSTLALAINTTNQINPNIYESYFELVGLFSLFVAGLAGISLIHFTPALSVSRRTN